jgi:hypothetical protein
MVVVGNGVLHVMAQERVVLGTILILPILLQYVLIVMAEDM